MEEVSIGNYEPENYYDTEDIIYEGDVVIATT